MRSITAICLGLLSAVLAMSGCDRFGGGGDSGICLAVAHPAERELPAKVKTIAVMQFTSATPESKPQAIMASDMLSSKLNETIGAMGSNRCRIVDRNNLKDLLKESDLADAGITESKAAQAGAKAGADTVIVGSIQVLSRDEQGTKSEPGFDIATRSPTMKTVSTLRRTAQVSINFKMCDVGTADTLMSKSCSKNADTGAVKVEANFLTGGGTSSMKSADAMIRELAADCVSQFCGLIAAHVECHMLPLVAGKTSRAKAAKAIAESGDYAEAAKAFDEVVQANPEDHAAAYDLGVVRMFLNDAAGAKRSLDKAVRMKDDKRYIKARALLTRAMESGNAVLRPASEQERAECESRLSSKKH
ncbi:MAG: CsgG/HfaB family protein [Phycisphaerae bacterium]|nr:CsgG/HfaB family protein [Phycisphaerae bacterium]